MYHFLTIFDHWPLHGRSVQKYLNKHSNLAFKAYNIPKLALFFKGMFFYLLLFCCWTSHNVKIHSVGLDLCWKYPLSSLKVAAKAFQSFKPAWLGTWSSIRQSLSFNPEGNLNTVSVVELELVEPELVVKIPFWIFHLFFESNGLTSLQTNVS